MLPVSAQFTDLRPIGSLASELNYLVNSLIEILARRASQDLGHAALYNCLLSIGRESPEVEVDSQESQSIIRLLYQNVKTDDCVATYVCVQCFRQGNRNQILRESFNSQGDMHHASPSTAEWVSLHAPGPTAPRPRGSRDTCFHRRRFRPQSRPFERNGQQTFGRLMQN